MSVVVVPAYLIFDHQMPSYNTPWWPLLGLTLVTSLSRLALFLGIKHIGGMQTALLGLAELLVAILFSYIWLHDNLSMTQWLGAVGLCISLLLVKFEKQPKIHHGSGSGWFSWIRSPDVSQDVPWGPHE
jgi:drug/metabolite transporter (DMT)-like permease